jgi:MFS family permease
MQLIQGLILTSATVGILLTSGLAGRLAKTRSQRLNIRSGFVLVIIGIVLSFALGSVNNPNTYFLPAFFVIGLGFGIMLTSSVTVVQSEFPDKDQGEISGLSRSISNLGSSFGVSIVGSILVMSLSTQAEPFIVALIAMMGFAVVGMIAAILIPKFAENHFLIKFVYSR